MFKILIGLVFTLSVFAQNQVVPGDIFPDADSNKNFIKNPMSLQNLIGVTATTHSLTRNTSSPIMGSADFQISAGAAGNVAWALKAHENFLTGQNCEFKGLYNGGGNTWTADIYDGTNVLNSISLPAVTQVTPFNVVYPCGSGSPTRTVRFVTTASASQLNVDKLYYGIVTSIGQFSAISDWQAYTPTFTGFGTTSSPTGWWRQVGDKIEIRFSVTTGTPPASLASMSLPTGYSINANKLNITNNNTAASGDYVGTTSTSQSATNVRGSVLTAPGTSTTLLYFSFQDGGTANKLVAANGSSVAAPSVIFTGEASVPIQGWSASQSAASVACLTNGQCESEFSATVSSAGVVSGENVDWINGNCSIASTSQFTCTFNTSFFSVAPNCTVTNFSTSDFGVRIRTQSSSAFTYETLVTSTGANAATAANIQCSRAGSDYRPRIPAPILIGSVTSNSVGALRIETAYVSSAGVVSLESSDWISGNASGSAPYVLTFISGTFSSRPNCFVQTFLTGNIRIARVDALSSSSISVQPFNAATSNPSTDTDFMIMCIGAR